MQKWNRKTPLNRFVVWIFFLTCTGHAGIVSKKFKTTFEGSSVEVFVTQEDGKGAKAQWMALLANKAGYPSAGASVVEMSAQNSALTAVNANFYREDQVDSQIPIGLVVHRSRIMALPSKFYPTIGVFADQSVDWDNVRFEATIEYKMGGQSVKQKLCRFNSPATRDCASLWNQKTSEELRNSVFIATDQAGLSLGRHDFEVTQTKKSLTHWVIQLSNSKSDWIKSKKITSLSINARLVGQRLGEKWNEVREAVSGSHVLTQEKIYPKNLRAWAQSHQPRTLTGVDQNGNAWVAVFDGRRETSRGISVKSAWSFVEKTLGAKWALNLDGGGSSTLLFEQSLMNKPSDGFPRAVAVGWGAR